MRFPRWPAALLHTSGCWLICKPALQGVPLHGHQLEFSLFCFNLAVAFGIQFRIRS